MACRHARGRSLSSFRDPKYAFATEVSKAMRVDKVRASREGHEFHEAWTARKALQLLWPDCELNSIAVEGLSPLDEVGASAHAIEIADITLYYGKASHFQDASRTTIAQFKYSIADQNAPLRASHASKTIRKFADAYRDHIKRYGNRAVEERLDFQLITNRPIYAPLLQAIDAISRGLRCSQETQRQASQIASAAGLGGRDLSSYASKLRVIGGSGSLPEMRSAMAGLVVDWSATSDPIASARLGQLRELVRSKAGHAGTGQNLITRTDILAAFNVADPEDLLPCRPSIQEIGTVVEREQLAETIQMMTSLASPLLVHAAGGVGKTVFMSSLAKKLGERDEVVFFDCFGGGAYRSPSDARHLSRKGLIHIANTLAFRGLCDPMLPAGPDAEALLNTFRRRLAQCMNTITRTMSGRSLVLFIDAIDNAEIAAKQHGDDCFPVNLLDSMYSNPIVGIKLIVACRTERLPSTYGKYHKLELRPFSADETRRFLSASIDNVTDVEIAVAHARSGGNPRVLDYLAKSGRGLLDPSEIGKQIELDQLIQDRIVQAFDTAIGRGQTQSEIDAFLVCLAVLPPPVPVDELAAAQGIDPSAVQSFAADLYPLLELTRQGLMFRDEPTETLVRSRYAGSRQALRKVSQNLLARQDLSIYAARALPGLLHELDDGGQLFNLAFDERFPASVMSTVGKRDIRYARLKAAALHAAMKSDYNRLVRLLLVLSTIAEVDQRGAAYILDHPDLVVASSDVDAMRRLFDSRTSWPGARHARLTIAYSLSGDFEEAYRHAAAAGEWLNHHRRADRDDRAHEPGPERPDIAAIPFLLLSQGKAREAARFLGGWRDWYTFEVSELIFDFALLAHNTNTPLTKQLHLFYSEIYLIGPLTAAISFQETGKATRRKLVQRLAQQCAKANGLDLPDRFDRERRFRLQDGLRKASAIALSIGLRKEALVISRIAPHQRPSLWQFGNSPFHDEILPFVFSIALEASTRNIPIQPKDLLPKELRPACARIDKGLTGKAFRDMAKRNLSIYLRRKEANQHSALSNDQLQEAERFIDLRLDPLLALTDGLSALLAAPLGKADKSFRALVVAWKDARNTHDPYRRGAGDQWCEEVGLDLVMFALWARRDLNAKSIDAFLTTSEGQQIGASQLIQIVSLLAKVPPLHDRAGQQALKARQVVDTEQDVAYRASLLGGLGRAMLPASINEASAYFRAGLEHMDAIGSGDYHFTSELLSFASAVKGDELDEKLFHTLSNICELNIPGDPEKFPWGAYGRGMSRTAGPRGLAKLCRWDDRSIITLSNTLLPYLTALVEDGKIAPNDALSMNWLADPVEYYQNGTAEFATAIRQKAGPNSEIVSELVRQFELCNPGLFDSQALSVLASLAAEALGPSSETSRRLSASQKRFPRLRDTLNDHQNQPYVADPKTRKRAERLDRQNRTAVNQMARTTDPTDTDSLLRAMKSLSTMENSYQLKDGFFAKLREKVPYDARAKYVREISSFDGLDLYWKLAELRLCKQNWAASSAVLADVYREAAPLLVRLHALDFVKHGWFSDLRLKEISDLTGVSADYLVLELIKVFARPESSLPGAVWLGFATIICPIADGVEGRLALAGLLESQSARLADGVRDGIWVGGLYPKGDITSTAAGLVWRRLGSPSAEDRWRAAHSIRSFARFGRWPVVEALVDKLAATDAGPFQAPELAFYFLHARLWLLIALSRVAVDYPREIAKFSERLISIANETGSHVLMRHFAARTIVTCVDAGELSLPSDLLLQLGAVDSSPYARLPKSNRKNEDFYGGRPGSSPKPDFEFDLDYDFHKYEVDGLSRVFGQPCWKVADLISTIVHQQDANASSMYDSGGRDHRRAAYGMTSRFHSYGQQLGWHALFVAAGKLLAEFPVTDDAWHDEDPWGDWLRPFLLSRDDGLWLSDGTSGMPLDTAEVLLERAGKSLGILGDPKRLLGLVGISHRVGKELVVEGRWYSADGVCVHISSGMAPPSRAARVARKLVRQEPLQVWIPVLKETEPQDVGLRSSHCAPLVVSDSGEARLDEHDPFGTASANSKSRLANGPSALCSLTTGDPFSRQWSDKRGMPMLRREIWVHEGWGREDEPRSGHRLLCRTSLLKRILAAYKSDLVVLIKLERYEKGYRGSGKWTHTVAAASISQALHFEYFKGRINYQHKSAL